MQVSTRSMGAPLSLARSSLLLAVGIVSTTLLLMPVAFGRDGWNGPAGIFAAAFLVLLCGWFVELLGQVLRASSSLAGPLLGMAIRMLPPLAVCAMLAAKGAHGREYLPFIGYLLTLYLVALAVETWLAVRRNAEPPVNSDSPAR